MSCDQNGNCRAFLWQNGVMIDLNSLTPPDSSLYLLIACDINSRGEIVGFASDQSNGELVAFAAVPCGPGGAQACTDAAQIAVRVQRPKVVLPDELRKGLRQHLGLFKQLGSGLVAP